MIIFKRWHWIRLFICILVVQSIISSCAQQSVKQPEITNQIPPLRILLTYAEVFTRSDGRNPTVAVDHHVGTL